MSYFDKFSPIEFIFVAICPYALIHAKSSSFLAAHVTLAANPANLMTPKQWEVWHSYLNDDWKYLINSGAVRAGKTYIDNIIFLAEIRRVKEMAAKR